MRAFEIAVLVGFVTGVRAQMGPCEMKEIMRLDI
jgi:hypothetical protein